MLLTEIVESAGVDDDLPSSYCSLFRVALFNINIALDRNHIEVKAAKDVFQELLDALEANGWAPKIFQIDRVYLHFASILADTDPALFFCRHDEISTYLSERPVSLQPSWAFKHWLDDSIHAARLPLHTTGDVEALLAQFATGESRKSGAAVGFPILWLTPYIGVVRDIVVGAERLRRANGPVALETSDNAQRLRDLLGLHWRLSPERAILVMLTGTVGDLKAALAGQGPSGHRSAIDVEMAGRPEPAVSREMAAPTQFDAGSYPRFRHWPEVDDCLDPNYGRTWDLSCLRADGKTGGAPEFVVKPRPLEAVSRMVSLGPIQVEPPTEEQQTILDRDFADALCGSTTIESLLSSISAKVDL